MNRRGFIRNLAAILAASTGPSILALGAFDRFRWRAPEGNLMAVINPEWVNAEYETVFIMFQTPIHFGLGPRKTPWRTRTGCLRGS
jgi:hypothetical protein